MSEILLFLILILMGINVYLLLNICTNIVEIYCIICRIHNQIENGGK